MQSRKRNQKNQCNGKATEKKRKNRDVEQKRMKKGRDVEQFRQMPKKLQVKSETKKVGDVEQKKKQKKVHCIEKKN